MTSVYSTAEVVIPDNPPTPMGYHLLLAMPKVEERPKAASSFPAMPRTARTLRPSWERSCRLDRMLTQKQIPVSLQGHGAVRGLGNGQQICWPPL